MSDNSNDPFKERINKHIMRNQNTFDIPELMRYEGHYVFVYGTLKCGHERSVVLQNDPECRFQGIATTVDDCFELVNTLFGFPVLLENTRHQEAHVKGELWYVPTKTIFALDIMEGNGKMYQRETVSVRCLRYPNGPPDVVEAYTYIGRTEFWNKQMAYIRDLDIRKDKSSSYYIYTRDDADKYKDKVA